MVRQLIAIFFGKLHSYLAIGHTKSSMYLHYKLLVILNKYIATYSYIVAQAVILIHLQLMILSYDKTDRHCRIVIV